MKVWAQWSSNFQKKNDIKENRLLHYFVCFQMPNKRLHLKYFVL